jgi:uncharacterized protein (TIGR02145 family)
MIIGYLNNAPQKISIKRPCQGYYLRWWYSGWHYWFFLPGRLSLITEGEKYRTIGTKSVMMGTGQITFEQCQAIRTILNTREVYILTSYGWRNIRIEQGSVPIYGNQVNGYEIELKALIGSKEISITGFSPIADVPIVPIPDPGLCEVVIGTQIWMCKNYDSNYPGSRVYNNDEANRAIYGGLYTHAQINNPGFCPTGWHVPTYDEWVTLINYIGTVADAGGKLKEVGTTHWTAPNTDAVDTYGFKALGSGYSDGTNFGYLMQRGMFWCKDSLTGLGRYVYMLYDSGSISFGTLPSNYLIGLRLIKDTVHIPLTFDDWFLPSKDELNAMYTELHLNSLGGFDATTYRSSSEINATNGWSHDLSTNLQFADLKQNEGNLRACRSFSSVCPA